MSFFSFDIEKLTTLKAAFFITLVQGLIAAPMFYIFQFFPHLYQQIDFFKLVVISFAISSPLIIINYSTGSLFINAAIKNIAAEERQLMYGIITFLGNGVVFYFPCLKSYWGIVSPGYSYLLLIRGELIVIIVNISLCLLINFYRWVKKGKKESFYIAISNKELD
jgi:hypothetical protein